MAGMPATTSKWTAKTSRSCARATFSRRVPSNLGPLAPGQGASPGRKRFHLWRHERMAKQLLYTDEARKKLLSGADKLAHAVGITLGPTGRNVILDKSFGGPTVTKDGVTVSKEIELPDPFENMGAKLVNAVAQKTSDIA